MSSGLQITAAPQVFAPSSTARIMAAVLVCLVPATAWGIYIFGAPAAIVLSVSVVTAVVLELGFSLLTHKQSIRNGSALLTGLLIGLSLPPTVPLYVPAVATFFAVAVVKWTFGGLGGNWMNPALAGRVFAFFCFTDVMQSWASPTGLIDGMSAATPLSLVRDGLFRGISADGPISLLEKIGYPVSSFDVTATEWLNERVLSMVGITIPEGYMDLLFGNMAGSIGEVSALLLLAGSVYLVAQGIARWEICFTFFLTFAALSFVFGGIPYGEGFFAGDVLFQLFSGGVMLVMFFMATDTVTAPMASSGMIIYGLGVGGLTYVLRAYGAYPEGAALAVIVMNVFVPIIDRHTRPRRYRR